MKIREFFSTVGGVLVCLFLMVVLIVFCVVGTVCEWFGAKWPDEFARFLSGDPYDA